MTGGMEMQGNIEVVLGKRVLRGSPFKMKLLKLLYEIKVNRTSYFLLAPYIVLFFLFTVLPVAAAVYLSFTYFNIIESPRWVGWDNFRRLFLEDDVFLIAVKNTFVFSVITGPLSYIACFVFAWFVNELKPKIRALATLLFYAPSLSGQMYFIWVYLFSGDEYGLINSWLRTLGIVKEPIAFLQTPGWNMAIIMLVSLWMSLGTGFLVFIAGLQGIDRELFEAAAIDGIKNRWQELYYVTIPSLKPQLVFSAVLQIASTFSVSDVMMNLAGFPSPLYSAHTIVLHMIDYGNTRYEMGYASAIAVVLCIMTLATNGLMRKFIKPE